MNTKKYEKKIENPKNSFISRIKNYFFPETPLQAWQRTIAENPDYKTPEINLYILKAAYPSGLEDKITLYNKLLNHANLKYETLDNAIKDNLASYLSNEVSKQEAEDLVRKINKLEYKKDYTGINSILTSQLERYEMMQKEGFLKINNDKTPYQDKTSPKNTKKHNEPDFQYKNMFNIRPETMLS